MIMSFFFNFHKNSFKHKFNLFKHNMDVYSSFESLAAIIAHLVTWDKIIFVLHIDKCGIYI